jgi:hypothetical protein
MPFSSRASGGRKHDACLVVMDSLEFHVHSHVLKLHSTIFREKFAALDNKPRVNSTFEYKLVAVLNENGRWAWHSLNSDDVPV